MSARTDTSASIRFAFVGDICLAGGMQEELRKRGTDYPFSRVRETFQSADVVVGNLECCITHSGSDAELPENVMTVPEHLASGLCRSGINIVSLSNNHILDGGEAGLVSTQRFLDNHDIRHFGAGVNRHQAERPLFLDCKGLTVGFLGACDVPSVFATDSKAGVAPMIAGRMRRRLRECRAKANIVVVSIHADLEFTLYPAPSRVRFSRWLVEQGADLVIQHHPHVCQGIELHETGLIAYSLGNFIFRVHGHEYFESKVGTDWGVVLHVAVGTASTEDRFKYFVVPVTINTDNQTVPSIGTGRDSQLLLVDQISQGLLDWNIPRRARLARCVAKAKSSFYDLYYMGRRRGMPTMLRAGLAMLADPYERRWMYSLLSWGVLG